MSVMVQMSFQEDRVYRHDHRCQQGEAKANLNPLGAEFGWSLPAELLNLSLHALYLNFSTLESH